MSNLSPMAKQIVDYVRQYGGVSFVELERKIKGFSGNNAIHFPDSPNLILWPWVSPEAVQALNSITDILEIKPCHFLVYMADGKVPDMPIARRAKDYKTERWLPVVFGVKSAGKKPKGK